MVNDPDAPKLTPERRADMLARLEQLTEWPLTVLALALIPILLAPDLLHPTPHTRGLLDDFDYLIWGIFAVDLIVKVLISPESLRYLRRHWIDVLLVALPVLRPLRVLRSTRALRVLRLGRIATVSTRSLEGSKRLFGRHGLHFSLMIALVVIVLGGCMATIAERNQPNSSINSLPDGLWWAISTATTVGYGDTYPVTGFGRGIGVVLMLLGISIFGVITANIAAFFINEERAGLPKTAGVLGDDDDEYIRTMVEHARRMTPEQRRWLAMFAEAAVGDDDGRKA